MDSHLLSLADIIYDDDFDPYTFFENKLNRHIRLTSKKHIRKFNSLFQKTLKTFTFEEDWIHNLTNVELPLPVKTILALSPTFAFPNTHKSTDKIIIEMIKSIEAELE